LPASRANFLGNINTFFLGGQKWHQFGDKLARLLWFEVTSFFGYLYDDSLLFVKTFLWSRFGDTGSRTAKLSGNFLTFGLRSVFDGCDGLDRGTFGHGPFATLLFGSVTLSDVFAFLFESVFTFDDIIFDLVLMESSFTLRFINGFTFYFTLALANQRGVAKFDCFFFSLLLVFNETRFGEGLLAFFFLLGLKIGGVSSVALFTVSRMYAFNSNCFRLELAPKYVLKHLD
jgi:hypothetical protein